MHEIALKYLGKKSPFKFDNKKIGIPVVFGIDPVWLPADKAEWLMEVNPKMFNKVDEKNPEEPIEDAADMIKAKIDEPDDFDTYVPEVIPEEKIDEPGVFVCEKCKREYKDQVWYDKHIAKCEG